MAPRIPTRGWIFPDGCSLRENLLLFERVADRTLTERAEPAPSSRARTARRLGVLVVFSRGSSTPVAHPIAKGTVVGRDPETDLFTDDASCSRAHARLEPRDDALWVTDLASRNGTFVQGERVASSGARVPIGGVVRVGRTLLVVADVAPWLGERPPDLPGLVGGAGLDEVRARIETIAAARSPVLVLGETGTGKEVVGRLIHAQSGRSGPFVGLNCAAVARDLVDAELFGHSRGAFSGAGSARAGQFRTADGGTLLLDEVGEMPPAVQAKLLRTLETGEVRPIGEDKTVQVDVRVVAATNRDLERMIEAGAFRADLLHRLAGLRLELPPLRERPEDVPLLVAHFSPGADLSFSAAAMERLMLYRWPGNVRELRNVVTAAAAVARQRGHAEVEVEHLEGLFAPEPTESAKPAPLGEADRVRAALTAASGDVARAAAELSLSRSALYECLRRLGIRPREYRRR